MALHIFFLGGGGVESGGALCVYFLLGVCDGRTCCTAFFRTFYSVPVCSFSFPML